MFEKIRPLHDRVLIKKVADQEKTASGIIIPDAAREKTQTGEVVATGAGRVDNTGKVTPLAVKAGDMVFFGKYAGTEAGDDFVIMREEEILGIVEKSAQKSR